MIANEAQVKDEAYWRSRARRFQTSLSEAQADNLRLSQALAASEARCRELEGVSRLVDGLQWLESVMPEQYIKDNRSNQSVDALIKGARSATAHVPTGVSVSATVTRS